MHCHLDLYPDPFKVAYECKARNIYTLSVTTTPKAWYGTNKLAEGSKRIRTALGLHPQLAHQRSNELELFDELLVNTNFVGEIGLDGSKSFKEHSDIQAQVFRHILKSVSRAGGKIMTIHSRSSASNVLEELRGIEGKPILHWFTGTPSELKQAVKQNCWFSVGPAMLNTKRGRELTQMMPRKRVLTETDGPFAKYDGKPLLPWESEIAVKQLSRLWKLPLENTYDILKSNLSMLISGV